MYIDFGVTRPEGASVLKKQLCCLPIALCIDMSVCANVHLIFVSKELQYIIINLVEAHCYSIGNHVAVETDGNLRRFNSDGLCQFH